MKIKFILVLAIFFAGCSMQIKRTINSDGTGIDEIAIDIDIDKLPAMIKDLDIKMDRVIEEMTEEKQKVKEETIYKKQTIAIFSDIKKAPIFGGEDYSIKFRKQKDGSFYYEEQIDFESINNALNELGVGGMPGPGGIQPAGFGNIEKCEIKISVTMPGIIKKTNAKNKKGRTATWSFKLEDLEDEEATLKAVCGPETKSAKADIKKYKKLKNMTKLKKEEDE